MSLKKDVESTNGLKGHFKRGLEALKSQDKARITVTKPQGSVDVDGALQVAYPTDARWDYLIGQTAAGGRTRLIWLEVHSADGENTVKEVMKKHEWLLRWMRTTPLKTYPAGYYWVSSGKCSFTSRSREVKELTLRGVYFCGRHQDFDNRF